MNDSGAVRRCDAVGDLSDELNCLPQLQTSVCQAVAERFAFQQLHGDEVQAVA